MYVKNTTLDFEILVFVGFLYIGFFDQIYAVQEHSFLQADSVFMFHKLLL
jgi:hypothetical protein